MPTGDDFIDNTPPPTPNPKKRFRYPPPDGTGQIPWAAGQTFQQALASGLPAAIRGKTLPADALITITVEVQEV